MTILSINNHLKVYKLLRSVQKFYLHIIKFRVFTIYKRKLRRCKSSILPSLTLDQGNDC